MPRLPPSLFRQAKRQCPNLAALVPACRDLQSAKSELRWLTEFARETTPQGHFDAQQKLLERLCRRRGRGVPLQYILGSQPFGPLDIKCTPGVLIPRAETEAYTLHLVNLIESNKGAMENNSKINIIDFCTGTGCIPLLVFALLQHSFQRLTVRGVDIAPAAVDLAKRNIEYNIKLGRMAPSRQGQALEITKGDIFSDDDVERLSENKCDVLISNPPYISRKVWDSGCGQLGYSVRKYEPRLALVPDATIETPIGWQLEDIFYLRLLTVSMILKPSVALFEMGDEDQICRVLSGLFRHEIAAMTEVEVWRDWPDVEADGQDTETELTILGREQNQTVSVKGRGRMRSIFMRNHWDQ